LGGGQADSMDGGRGWRPPLGNKQTRSDFPRFTASPRLQAEKSSDSPISHRERKEMNATKTRRTRTAKPSLDPQKLSVQHAWYYEEERAIVVVVEARDKAGNYLGVTTQVRIPWSQLLHSARRCKPEAFR
jgi:hypothetical protein